MHTIRQKLHFVFTLALIFVLLLLILNAPALFTAKDVRFYKLDIIVVEKGILDIYKYPPDNYLLPTRVGYSEPEVTVITSDTKANTVLAFTLPSIFSHLMIVNKDLEPVNKTVALMEGNKAHLAVPEGAYLVEIAPESGYTGSKSIEVRENSVVILPVEKASNYAYYLR